MKKRVQVLFEDRKTLIRGGGRLLIVSQHGSSSAEPQIITLEKGGIANCLRSNGGLNATDNTIVQYAKECVTN